MGGEGGPVYVDTREAGEHKRYGVNHGIARYAREVIPRLAITWTAFDGPLRRATPLDAINPRRARFPTDAVVYSPGYSAGIARCSQLLTIHDLTHLRSRQSRAQLLTRTYYERVVKPAVRRTHHVLTVSDTSANAIRDWLNDDRVTVHNAGIGCSSEFTPDGDESSFGRPYFLYVGNFKPHKNPRPLFAAMSAFPDHLLVVVAAQADVVTAEALAQECGCSDQLKLLIAVDDATLAALYRGADALVFPSRWEGFGLPVLEALMTNTNIVYYRGAASVYEICNGAQFPVEHADDTQEFRYQMERAATARFECPTDLTHFNWDVVARKVESLISQVRHEAAALRQISSH